MASCVRVGSDHHCLFGTIVIDLEKPPIFYVLLFDCTLHENLLSFGAESVEKLVVELEGGFDALVERVSNVNIVGDPSSLLSLLHLPKFSERRVVAMRKRRVWVLKATFWDMSCFDFLCTATHLKIFK